MSYTKVEKWYDKYTKSWVVQKLDSEGNQVGRADYVYTKREASNLTKEYKQDIKLKIRRRP